MNVFQLPSMLPWLLSYLFNAVWQVPLVFAAAWIAARMLRRADPRVGHRVWVGALLLQIALPACSTRIGTLWHAMLSLLPSHSASGNGVVRVLLGPGVTAGSTFHLPFALQAAIALAWASIVAWFALRLLWGIAQTRTLGRIATAVVLPADAAARWARHCARSRLAPPPQIVTSSRTVAPITIGMRRALILLPPQLLETISPNDLDAVLAHETAHIARRDFTKNLLYSLVSLPIAWHPIAWRTRARLAETRELICDEAAALSLASPRQYAHSLLRLASAVAGQPRLAAFQAVSILDFTTARALERRVMNLTQTRVPLSTSRRILLGVACSILGLATCTSALALHTDFSVPTAVDENKATTKAPTKIAVRAEIMAKERISGDNPTYPPEARKKKTQGTVVLDTTIGKDGAVENIRVQKTPDESLAKNALEAVRTWRYRPYLLNGEPVEVKTTVNVTFCIEPCTLSGWWNHPGSTP